MAVLVLLGLALAGLGAWGLSRIDFQVTRLAALSDDNTRSLRIERLMETMREASVRLQFAAAQTGLAPDDVQEAQQMLGLLQAARQAAGTQEQGKIYQSMIDRCTACHQLAAKLVTLNRQAEDSRARLFTLGEQLMNDGSRLLTAAHQVGTPEIVVAAEAVHPAVLALQESSWRSLIADDASAAGTSQTNAASALGVLDAMVKLPLPDDMHGLAKTVGSELDAYSKNLDTAVSSRQQVGALFQDQMLPLVREQMTAAKAVVVAIDRSFAATKAASAQAISRTTAAQELIAGVALLLGVLIAYFVGRSVAGPVMAMTAAMSRLAAGEIEIEVPSRAARDELGAMAGAVEVFKQNAIQRRRLEAEQQAQAKLAEEQKRVALIGMAETIETEMETVVASVNACAATMMATAEQLQDSAGRTGLAADSAASAATQTLANAQTVASAADELAASIREIGRQVGQSTAVVERAVAAGKDAHSTIEALNACVGQIGAVTDVISEIAAKTNLLALNATIEAARAGNAGKGFAVVAAEVKQLATQTARSTTEIANHIGEVRAATGASVAAVNLIEQTIDEMNTIANSIAAAVEEQGAATAEIARNVTEAATASKEVTSRTGQVLAEAEQTSGHANEVHNNTVTLRTQVDELKKSVVQAIRSATPELNR